MNIVGVSACPVGIAHTYMTKDKSSNRLRASMQD